MATIVPDVLKQDRPISYPPAMMQNGWNKRKIFNVIAATIVFPVGILWLIKKIIGIVLVRAYANNNIQNLILPASTFNNQLKSVYRDSIFQTDIVQINKPYDEFKVCTPDGVALSCCILWKDTASERKFDPASKWVVYFNPNGAPYEADIPSLAKMTEFGCNVMLFNYRQVMRSSGTFKKASDLVLDGHTVVQYLKDKGIPTKNITLIGRSLGGGVSAKVGALHPEVNAANLVSFCTISNFLVYKSYCHLANLRQYGNSKVVQTKHGYWDTITPLLKTKNINPQYRPSVIKRIWLSFTFKIQHFLISTELKERDLELNALEAWPKIKGHKWIVTAQDDEMMMDGGTLAKALKRSQKDYKKVDSKIPKNAAQVATNKRISERLNLIKSRGTGHNDDFSAEAQAEHERHLKIALQA